MNLTGMHGCMLIQSEITNEEFQLKNTFSRKSGVENIHISVLQEIT